jgi:hypothetical protein
LISAALNAHDEGTLQPHPDCRRAVDLDQDGELDPCVITPNEVRQLMASGTVGGEEMPDDVNFASPTGGPEPVCSPIPVLGCHSPFGLPGTSLPPSSLQSQVSTNRPVQPVGSEPALRSYPARHGHDQFYGYGRVNINRSVRQLLAEPEPASGFESRVPPEAELESPSWNEQVDPALATVPVIGSVWARGGAYSCQVLVAPGHYPHSARASAVPPGDFRVVPAGSGGACDGSNRTTAVDEGKLAEIDVAALKAQFPPGTDFTGPEPVPTTANGNGRPNQETRGFVVKVVVSKPAAGGAPAMTGEDQRAAYLLRDGDLLDAFPQAIRPAGQLAAITAECMHETVARAKHKLRAVVAVEIRERRGRLDVAGRNRVLLRLPGGPDRLREGVEQVPVAQEVRSALILARHRRSSARRGL